MKFATAYKNIYPILIKIKKKLVYIYLKNLKEAK